MKEATVKMQQVVLCEKSGDTSTCSYERLIYELNITLCEGKHCHFRKPATLTLYGEKC